MIVEKPVAKGIDEAKTKQKHTISAVTYDLWSLSWQDMILYRIACLTIGPVLASCLYIFLQQAKCASQN